MREIIDLIQNPRFWSAYIYMTFPMLGCLIAGGYLIIKEEITKCLKHKKDK